MLAEYRVFGRELLTQRLIVECKATKRPVTKAHVLTLTEVVQDVGASLGILLCEAGFQPAARAAAENTNVRLCSLRELKEFQTTSRVHGDSLASQTLVLRLAENQPLVAQPARRGMFVAGDRVDDRYTIQDRLGSGGDAEVFLAEDQELGRRVALKLLNERHAADEQFVERFRREAQSAAGLNHPNIVSIFDRGYAEGTYYIAMEYLDGRTLKELLVRNGPTPIPIAIDYARQILGALAFAHRNGIVHRDIKPHNIVVGGDGRLKVTDFGIARIGASDMTAAGLIVGTPHYLSPEQARGVPVDQRSDIYSLGIVLYEMLSGDVPFSGDDPFDIARKHVSQAPEPPSKLRPEVPHDLDAIVMRALAKEPEGRYASAEEMDADLARVARGGAVSRETEDVVAQVLGDAAMKATRSPTTRVVPPTPAPPVYRAPTPYYEYEEAPGRRAVWPWLLALALIQAGAAGGWYFYSSLQHVLQGKQRSNSGPTTTAWRETTGGIAHTWSNYQAAGGQAGPDLPAGRTVDIACRVRGFRVGDGNVWWYRIRSAPWSGRFYASADAFYNNGNTTGRLRNTRLVDTRVGLC